MNMPTIVDREGVDWGGWQEEPTALVVGSPLTEDLIEELIALREMVYETSRYKRGECQ